MMDALQASGIEFVLANPFFLLVVLLTLFFLIVILFTLNNSLEYKSTAPDQINKKLENSSERFDVEIISQKRPVMLFVMLFSMIIYNLIAWFVRDQLDQPYFELFYELFTGFVVFLLLWVGWLQLSTFLTKVFLREHPTMDVRNYLKDKSAKLLLKYTFYWSIVYNVAFPLIVLLIVMLIYPRAFFAGMILVLLIGLGQNVLGYVKISKAD